MTRSKTSKKSSNSGMKRPLALLGGLLVVLGVLLSIVMDLFGWWNYSINISYSNWINAFGGLNWNNSIENLYSDDSILEMIPGVIAIVGGILILIRKPGPGLIGALVVFFSVALFINNLDSFNSLNNFIEVNNGNLYWWTSGNFYCHIGIGLIITSLGALLGLIGSLTKE